MTVDKPCYPPFLPWEATPVQLGIILERDKQKGGSYMNEQFQLRETV